MIERPGQKGLFVNCIVNDLNKPTDSEDEPEAFSVISMAV